MEKLTSFKKFSELQNEAKKEAKKENTKVAPSAPVKDVAGTPSPNIPTQSTKMPKAQSTRYMKPEAQSEKGVDYSVPEGESIDEKKIQLIGKIAKLPKGVKASKGLNFMENIKVPKSSIWYIMVEREKDTELQMLKYNTNEGVDLSKFTNELKGYYSKKFAKNEKLVKLIESIQIDGDDKYSFIKSIPSVSVDGKKLITIITEDLIKLLSK